MMQNETPDQKKPSIFRILFSAQMLALVLVLLLSAFIWFVGPLLAFSGMRPLENVAMRVTVMILTLALALIVLLKKPLHLIGIATLCLLIWHVGPLLAMGKWQPLLTVLERVAAIGLVLFCYAMYGVMYLWQRMRKDENLRATLLRLNTGSAPSQENIDTAGALKDIDSKFNQTLRNLKAMHGGGGLRRLFEGKKYLYDLPWYMVIGHSGVGKTSAVLNSGLEFPMDDHAMEAKKSRSGTIQCDWWLSNKAVLVDTSGRYVSQDSPGKSDASEWKGFLLRLRAHRGRAPINGAIVAIDAQELLKVKPEDQEVLVANLRSRLTQLRSELEIRFPVYVTITKMDMLQGFQAYFQSLTVEARAQVWGFTFPYINPNQPVQDKGASGEQLLVQLQNELTTLVERLEAGVKARLQEEFDRDKRADLYAFTEQFSGLAALLPPLLATIFLDSRFDATQLHHTLRGVYFTSAAQSDVGLSSNHLTLMERVKKALHLNVDNDDNEKKLGANISGTRSYFLHDVFARVIIPEAHLVRPNLRWEARMKILSLIGHTISVIIFLSLASALSLSFAQNETYLKAVSEKKNTLKTLAGNLFAKNGDERLQDVPDVLTAAQGLPLYRGLDVDAPALNYRYGLYTGSDIKEASEAAYNHLADHLLLPQIVQRMETVLREAMTEQDAKKAYNTLRVYLQMHDKGHYNANDVKTWVLADWEENGSAEVFGGRASMVGHINQLFANNRGVQSSQLKNEALVQDARAFLNGNTSTQRLYERAKQAMSQDAPQDFNLIRAVGAQAGTVFVLRSGAALDKGVPGLFTYDGYINLFDKRLPEFVKLAQQDDAWVMGRKEDTTDLITQAKNALDEDPMMADIRRLYLTEYTQHWTVFLDDIGTVTGSNLAFDLTVLRAFASPDSPLTRLARAAARETTLSKPLLTPSSGDKGFFDKASDKLGKAGKIVQGMNIRPQEQMERDLVDNHFAALREVVTGQADYDGESSGGNKAALDNISNLLNEYYTVLVVADTALGTNSLPPAATDTGAKLKLEAGKLPAPFKVMLTALADSGTEKVTQGASTILNTQAQAQLNRIMTSLQYQVGEPCRRSIEGRYPFAAGTQEVSIEDFNQIFAAGGAADTFFQKQLSPYVDTSSRPWRYKTAQMMADEALVNTIAGGAMPSSASSTKGPTLISELLALLAKSGPNPDAFARMSTIRNVFFREPGSKRMAWKMAIKTPHVDPAITELIIDIDGQAQRYVHGPVEPWSVTWPGTRGGGSAELTATPRISPETSSIIAGGPWALMRLIEKAKVEKTASPGRVLANFNLDGRRAMLDIDSGSSLPNPLTTDLLKTFQCPGGRG